MGFRVSAVGFGVGALGFEVSPRGSQIQLNSVRLTEVLTYFVP